MRGRFSGADNSPDFIAGSFIRFRPRVNNEKCDRSHHPESLPAVAVGVRIMPSQSKRIVKDELCGFKTEAVIDFVRPVLFVSPYPMQTPLHVAT